MNRIYFNRKSDFPRVWSVDNGTQASEHNVLGAVVHLPEGEVSTNYTGEAAGPDVPVAWLALEGFRMELKNGVAHFYPKEAQ